jgi:hypothetical protein
MSESGMEQESFNGIVKALSLAGENSRRATGPMQSASKNRCCPQTGLRFAPILRYSLALADPAVWFNLGNLYQKGDETPALRVTYLRLANHTRVEVWPSRIGDALCIAESISANLKA